MNVVVPQLGVIVEEGERPADLEDAPGEVVLPFGSPVHQLLQMLLERGHGLGRQQHALVRLHAVHVGQHGRVSQGL